MEASQEIGRNEIEVATQRNDETRKSPDESCIIAMA